MKQSMKHEMHIDTVPSIRMVSFYAFVDRVEREEKRRREFQRALQETRREMKLRRTLDKLETCGNIR